MITLTLPYPISANRYWRPVSLGKHITIVPTKEAKDYRKEVMRIVLAAGIVNPLRGRIAIHVDLYPHRPLDFAKRMRQLGSAWDDTVQCLDLDNANKVLLDSLKGVAIDDDKWVRRLSSERMEPDGEARVVVSITQIEVERPVADLFEATA